MKNVILSALVCLAVSAAPSVHAKDKPKPVTVTSTTPDADVPSPVGAAPPDGALEVTATGTLEWLREDQMYVARGNAVAKHNDTTLKGDVLVAHYNDKAGKKGSTQISEVTADGDPVILMSPTAVAYGQHGVYDLNKHQALLLGNNLKLVTTEEVVTAKDTLEYFEDISTGVARGDAVMVRGDDRLTADVIAAKFTDPPKADAKAGGQASAQAASPSADTAAKPGTDADGKKTSSRRLERLDAKGHVVLTTPTDIVTGNEAVYNPLTDQTTVLGDVHLTRDQNQMDGARAEVDMATGISRVYAAPDTRVRGLFIPKKKDKTNVAGDGNGDSDAGDTGGSPTAQADAAQ